MKLYTVKAGFPLLAFIAAAYFATPPTVVAADNEDSPGVTSLLADAKAEAVELKTDAGDMDSFTRSNLSWASYATKAEMIKEHVNNSGKLLGKLQEAEATASPWQQIAIRRIEPLLREIAANTEATINHLNEDPSKIHFPAFIDHVKANHQLATALEALVRDFVSYGEAKRELERLGETLETTD